MLPFGYDPKNYGGKIWWNENNPEMKDRWGTQEDYDSFIAQGGTWQEYVELIQSKIKENENNISNILAKKYKAN